MEVDGDNASVGGDLCGELGDTSSSIDGIVENVAGGGDLLLGGLNSPTGSAGGGSDNSGSGQGEEDGEAHVEE